MLSNIPFIPLTLYWLWKVFIITSHFPFHSVLICRQRISTGTSCRFFFDQPPMSANTRSDYIVYLKNGIYVCPASCSAFMDECKERFHAWCCHWLAISAALTTKVGQFQNLFWATKKKNYELISVDCRKRICFDLLINHSIHVHSSFAPKRRNEFSSY